MNPLTLGSRIGSNALEPSEREIVEVSKTVALSAAVRAIGAQRLLLARMDWDRLFSSANTPGALTPEVARATMTRRAMKDAAARRAHAAKARNRAFQSFVNGWRAA